MIAHNDSPTTMSGKAQTGKLANKGLLAYSKAGIGKGRHRPARYAKGHHRPPRGAKARREPQTAKGRRGSANDATGRQRPPRAKQRTPRDTKGRHRPPAATGRAQARKICEQRRLSTAMNCTFFGKQRDGESVLSYTYGTIRVCAKPLKQAEQTPSEATRCFS